MRLPACGVLGQTDVEHKNHQFSDWNTFGKHFFPCVENLGLCKISFSEGKVVCFPFFLRENVQSIQCATNMFTYVCVCVKVLLFYF